MADKASAPPPTQDPADSREGAISNTPRGGHLRVMLKRVRFRLRLTQALLVLGRAGVLATVVASIAFALGQMWLVATALACLVAAGCVAWAWRQRTDLPARTADSKMTSGDLFLSAETFSNQEALLPFEEATVGAADELAKKVVVSEVAPVRMPRSFALWPLALWPLLLPYLPKTPKPVSRPTLQEIAPTPIVHHDDAEAYRAQLAEKVAAAELAAPRDALLETLAGLETGRLERLEALRALEQIESSLSTDALRLNELLREPLSEVGDALSRNRLTEQAGRALNEHDLQRSAEALRAAAQSMNEHPPTQAELESLRRATDAARQALGGQDLAAMNEEERRRQEELAEQEREADTDPERRLLQRNRQELSELRSRIQQEQRRQRELSRLERNLRDASSSAGAGQTPEAQQAIEDAARELERMAGDEQTEEQRRELEELVNQLREQLQREGGEGQPQQGQDGQPGQQGQQGQGGQMERFTLRAGGQGNGESVHLVMPGQQGQGQQGQGQQGQGQQGQGQQGQGQQGQGQQGQGQQGQGQQGQGQQGQGQQGQGQQGQGQQGQGQQGQGSRTLTLGGGGPPNAIIEIPGAAGTQPGGQPGTGPGQGSQAGSGHDPTDLDSPTALNARAQNVRVQGVQNAGPSRSETIRSAAAGGFATRPYQSVFTDYANHAEEQIERDEIPPGYRFYVRRYFQLIRPRNQPTP